MYELQDKVGVKIAKRLHVVVAMVTLGVACANLLATVATITGADVKKINMLPNLPGIRPDVLVQKTRR